MVWLIKWLLAQQKWAMPVEGVTQMIKLMVFGNYIGTAKPELPQSLKRELNGVYVTCKRI